MFVLFHLLLVYQPYSSKVYSYALFFISLFVLFLFFFHFCVDVVLFHYLMFTSPITALVAMLDLYF